MLHLYNTLTHKLEEFKPITDKKVGLYTCGPTVYHYAHIGNLRSYIFEDILKRVLQYNDYEVNHVMNITDVGHLTDDGDNGEDKMEKGSKREGKTAWEIAEFYTQAFQNDLKELNIESPTTWCKATDNIPEQIELVQTLIDKGFTYETSDGVYFDTTKFPSYGEMANLQNQELEAGSRVEIGEKKNPHDFALWKWSERSEGHPEGFQPQEKRQMEWEAFGRKGFPGWHIECSAMSSKYLGQHFDIHCGGIDHIPVHHTNEIAQSEAAFGEKPWVNYWMHGEFIVLKNDEFNGSTYTNTIHQCPKCKLKNVVKDNSGYLTEEKENLTELKVKCQNCGDIFKSGIASQKMSKSGDNFITLDKIIEKGIDPLAYRFFLLQTHYRKQLNFSWEALEAAQTGLNNLYKEASKFIDKDMNEDDLKEWTNVKNQSVDFFKECLNNDLDTPQSIAILWKSLKTLDTPAQKTKLILNADETLGLEIFKPAKKILESEKTQIKVPAEIQKLLDKRKKVREEKNWSESDRLRDEIKALGYTVEDTSKGQQISK